MTSGDGPINRIPASTHASAKSDRSDKNPYPGWIASTPYSCQKWVHIKKCVRSLVHIAQCKLLKFGPGFFLPLFKLKEQFFL